MSNRETRAHIDQWTRILNAALDADSWGQSLEAIDEYEKLATLIEQILPKLELSIDERSILSKVRQSVVLRVDRLQSPILKQKGINLEHMMKLKDVMKNVLHGMMATSFPISFGEFNFSLPSAEQKAARSSVEAFGEDDKIDPVVVPADFHDTRVPIHKTGCLGKLLPPPTIKASGLTTMDITVDRVGLKDAQTYIDARVTITVVDAKGSLLETVQETPTTNKSRVNYVLFGDVVHIQTPLEQLGHGSAIFFEFRHYKPKKKKVSVRCFAFMEYDEMKPSQDICLELYKKPTDFSRKRINLFSIKPLYMHLKVAFNKH